MDVKIIDVENWNKLGNEENLADYSWRSSPEFRSSRTELFNHHYINWKADTDYFNHYYVNGEVNMGRTIKAKNNA